MTPQRNVSDSRRRNQAGNSMVEGALVMIVFMTMIFGLMDFGRMVWSYTAISHGAREATRYAIVRGSDSGTNQATKTQIQDIVASRSPGLDSTNLTTTVTFSPDQSAGSTVNVLVNYKFYPIGPYIPVGPITLKSTSQMVIYQ
jgi:Flp pilus assembly protein TadG